MDNGQGLYLSAGQAKKFLEMVSPLASTSDLAINGNSASAGM